MRGTGVLRWDILFDQQIDPFVIPLIQKQTGYSSNQGAGEKHLGITQINLQNLPCKLVDQSDEQNMGVVGKIRQRSAAAG